MSTAVFDRLHHVLAAGRAAAETRLGAVLAEIAACRSRAQRQRAEIAGGGPESGPQPDAADLAAAAHWRRCLAVRARAEEARAHQLSAQATELRRDLARAFGREAAAAELAKRAHVQARREATRHAEFAAAIVRPSDPLQPELPSPEPSSPEPPYPSGADSPGIA